MFEEFNSLSNLLKINADRQQEMDDLFAGMRTGYAPSKKDLTLLYHTATHSVAEAQALLSAIRRVFSCMDTAPREIMPDLLLQNAVLPEQIEIDELLVAYLQPSEKPFVRQPY